MSENVNKSFPHLRVHRNQQNDDNQLLQFFPGEIWKMVLDSIQDPEALESCSNASPFFRTALLPRRTSFLFPKIFNSLAQKFGDSKDTCYEDMDDYNSDHEFIGQPADVPVEQKIWKHPGGLRLVCSTWNRAVDKYFQQHQIHYQNNFENTYMPNSSRRNGYFGEVRQVHFDELMAHFETTHSARGIGPRKNPFFQRSLVLKIQCQEIGDSENHVFNKVLEVYGQQIWYLSLLIGITHETMAEFYLSFKWILEHVPNLRILRVDYYMLGCRRLSVVRLEETIQEHPLPTLQNLRLIRNEMPTAIFMELLRRNGNVEMLRTGSCIIYSLEFPKLKELYCTIKSQRELLKVKKKIGKIGDLRRSMFISSIRKHEPKKEF